MTDDPDLPDPDLPDPERPVPLPRSQMDDLTSACPICAAVVLSATIHEAWHTTLTTPAED